MFVTITFIPDLKQQSKRIVCCCLLKLSYEYLIEDILLKAVNSFRQHRLKLLVTVT